jgi:hypothetical protein
MSLQHAAEAVRSTGRGEDTMLIHMTPDEVKGLQALAMAHGGSLTVNPETGLPEAGFLKSLLPTLIGAGLAATGIGAPMAGLIVGGIQTARTGDLGQGILAGLGAYGGAGFGQAAAAAAAPTTAGLTPGAVATGLPGGAANVANLANQPLATNLSTMGSGVSNIFSSGATGEAARTAAMQQLGGSATSAALRGTAALAGPLLEPAPMPEVVQPEESNYAGPYVPTERQARFPTADRDPMDSSEFQFFDVVNPIPGFQTMASSAPLPQNTYGPEAPRFAGIPVDMATDPARMRDYQANPQLYSFAEGGGLDMDDGGFVVDAHTVSEIGNGSSDAGHAMLAKIGGEPIKGPGDGTSDSIEANIGGAIPARVAKDESYLSKDDVAALGGGNLKKGEKMLYKLMAKAHESRKQKGRGQATGLDKLIQRMA